MIITAISESEKEVKNKKKNADLWKTEEHFTYK
jgi:hypothetical protein